MREASIEGAAVAIFWAGSIAGVTWSAAGLAGNALIDAANAGRATRAVAAFVRLAVGAATGAAAKNDALPTVKLLPSAKSEDFAIVSAPDATVVAVMPLLPGPLTMTLPGPETESEWPLPLTKPEIVREAPAAAEIAALLSKASGALIVWAPGGRRTVTVALAAGVSQMKRSSGPWAEPSRFRGRRM